MNRKEFASSLLLKEGRRRLFEDYLCRTSDDFKLRYGVVKAVMEKCFGHRNEWTRGFVDELVSGTVDVDAVLPRPRSSEYHNWRTAAYAIGGSHLKPRTPKGEPTSRYEPVTARERRPEPPSVSSIAKKHRLSRLQIKELNSKHSLTEIMEGDWIRDGERREFRPKEIILLQPNG